jgi:hypothetical protein
MRYFGPRSLSSVLQRVLAVSWFAILATVVLLSSFLAIAFFSLNLGDPITSGIIQEAHAESALADKEWRDMLAQPAWVKALVFPFLAILTILLLMVISTARKLLANFAQDAVFRQENVALISRTAKLLLAFSVVSFNFTSLLVSFILLMLCEILRSGTALQEEQDLTV